MVTVMKLTTFSLFLLVLIVVEDVHSNPHHSKAYKSFHGQVNSFLCRLRHRKVVLDVKRKAVGCVRYCPSSYEESYSLRWGHFCKHIVLPAGCADKYCIHCIPGYKWLNTFPREKRCIKECPIGYSTTAANTCYKIPSGCADKYCIRCQPGYKRLDTFPGDKRCITECPIGYLATKANRCGRCFTYGCAACSTVFTCTACKWSLALKTQDGSLRTSCENRCPRNYRKMKIEGIVKCVPDSYVTTTTTTTQPTTTTTTQPTEAPTPKAILPTGCTDKDCLNCVEGYVKFLSPNSGVHHCLNECPQGHTNLNSICVGCSDRRCASCKASLVECEECFPSYSMQLDASNNTVECVVNCPHQHELKILNGVSVCMIKTQPACPVTNCKQCGRTNSHTLHRRCEECNKGFKLFRGSFNDHCYTTCPAGYFPSVIPGIKVTTCAGCQVPFCNKCMHAGTCGGCFEPMVLDTSGRCTTCPPTQSYNFDIKRCISRKLGEEDKKKNSNVVFELVEESI